MRFKWFLHHSDVIRFEVWQTAAVAAGGGGDVGLGYGAGRGFTWSRFFCLDGHLSSEVLQFGQQWVAC